MSDPASNSSDSFSRSLRLLAWCVVGLLALAYLWFVRKNTAPYASNADASGYLNSARLLLDGKLSDFAPHLAGLAPPDWSYAFQQPFGFTVDAVSGRMVPTYPVGYPLHLLLAAPFVGLDWAVVALNTVTAAFAALLLFALGRQLDLPRAWSLAGVALLWASPVVIYHELWAMSDVLSMAWSMAAMAAALASPRRPTWALAAGFAVGIAVLVRPANLLLVLPVAVPLGLRWRAWLGFVAGGIPCAAFLAWYNVQLYGAILTTGYGDYSWAFASKNLAPNLVHFARALPLLLGPPAALLALALPWLSRRERLIASTVAVWIAAYVGFHAFYWFAGQSWWSLRFLLPAFPAIILAALLVGHRASLRLPQPWLRVTLPTTLLLFSLAWEITAAVRLDAVIMKRGEVIYIQASQWLRENAPADAILLTRQASGALSFYSNFPVVRYDLAGAAHLPKLYAAARAAGRPLYAVIAEPERQAAFDRDLPGPWELLAQRGMFTIWRQPPSDSASRSPAAVAPSRSAAR